MTPRKRLLETLLFGRPDRIPYQLGWPRESTLQAWYKQGLPRTIDLDSFNAFVGMDHWEWLPVNLGPLPAFEEIVLEASDRHKIWIDALGAKRLDHKDPATPGFVTRTYLEFPVKNRADFLEMKQRFDPATPGRLPENWEAQLPLWQNRDFVLGLTIASMFWRTRDWFGFEGLCQLFHDDPALVQEMMDFVADFTIASLDKILTEVKVDFVLFNEDMAYKTASMISPAMARQFLLPNYQKLSEFFHHQGVPLLMMDCDGHISELIPLWLEAGINIVSPIEIAANNNPLEYRRRFPKLGMFGGIDKRELRFDQARVKQEVMSKVPALLELGGFIPAIDHGVPPDIPLRNYLYMCELIKQLACGGCTDDEAALSLWENQLGPIEEMWTPENAFQEDE